MFQSDLQLYAKAIQAHLSDALAGPDDVPLFEAMRYSLEGGKCLRGYFVCASAALFDIPLRQAIYPAMAIEAIHAYSLIHDDLPAMDDDALRRGKPTVHKAWDEATAILAADALQSVAFEWLTSDEFAVETDVKLALTQSMAKAAGEMVLGQMRDIAMETREGASVTLSEIERMQRGKTGALIAWSCTAGARLARQESAPLNQYAHALGLAFQIADDLLDVHGTRAMMGKEVGKDADANKGTFVALLGVEGAQKRAHALVQEAQNAVSIYGPKAQSLHEAAEFIIARQK